MHMKRLLLLALLTPMVAFAQSKQDYSHMVDKFVKYYNKQQTDSICTLFPDERTTGIKCFWKNASTDGTYDLHGKITAYEYIGEEGTGDREVTMYKVVFSKKGAMVMSLRMNSNHKFTIYLLYPLTK